MLWLSFEKKDVHVMYVFLQGQIDLLKSSSTGKLIYKLKDPDTARYLYIVNHFIFMCSLFCDLVIINLILEIIICKARPQPRGSGWGVSNSLISKYLAHYSLSLKFLLIL